MRRLFLRRLSTAAAAATAAAATPPPPPSILTQQLHYVVRTLQGFCFLHLFWEHFYSVGVASGASMLPTINIEGDFIVVSKLYSRGRGVGVGDLISYVHPVDGPGVHVCKRVIGMPGDFVVTDPMGAPGDMLQVPEGHCWTTGDNLPYSKDSRYYGPVPLALVRGKVVARVWPDPRRFENAVQAVREGGRESE